MRIQRIVLRPISGNEHDPPELSILGLMPTQAYIDDVVALSYSTLARYQIGTDLYGQLTGPEAEIEFTVEVKSSELGASLEVLKGFHLAMTAAAVTIEYVERNEYTGGYIDLQVLNDLAAGPSLCELDLQELLVSSFMGKFQLNPLTQNGRKRILAIAGITTLLLIPVFGPIPTLVIAGLGYMNDALSPDDAPLPPPAPIQSVNRDLIESRAGDSKIELTRIEREAD